MKFAIACAMVLALFSPSASASDEAGGSPALPTLAASAKPDASTATVLPEAPSAANTSTLIPTTTTTPADAAPTANLSPAPAAVDPALGNGFLGNNSLAPIHALLAPPAALIKLKTPPRTHSFFDARNTLGFATLGASLTADALSTQKGLAYPGFVEMNPIARPFVQTRTGAAVYNAGSFGLMAGLMYWAHKTEHHKLERILPLAVGSWEGLLSARNYRVVASRAR